MSTRQPGNPRISDVDKPFSFSDLAALTAKSESEKGFSTPEKTQISSREISFIDMAAGE